MATSRAKPRLVVDEQDEGTPGGADPGYAARRLGEAVRELAIHQGPISERLRAARDLLRGALVRDFPAGLQSEFALLQGYLCGDVPVNRSQSLYSAKAKTQQGVAERVYNLHLQLEDHLRPSPSGAGGNRPVPSAVQHPDHERSQGLAVARSRFITAALSMFSLLALKDWRPSASPASWRTGFSSGPGKSGSGSLWGPIAGPWRGCCCGRAGGWQRRPWRSAPWPSPPAGFQPRGPVGSHRSRRSARTEPHDPTQASSRTRWGTGRRSHTSRTRWSI